jgi:small subunit ribosomal protein S5
MTVKKATEEKKPVEKKHKENPEAKLPKEKAEDFLEVMEPKKEAAEEPAPAEAAAKPAEPKDKEEKFLEEAETKIQEAQGDQFAEKAEMQWRAKTKLGADVLSGKYKSLEEILEKGELILEPEIVDALVPELKEEVVYIGGSPGKGGGIRRTATKMTARMHKSGRRFKLSALSIVGNGNGIVGVGMANSREHRSALEKSVKAAKLSVIRVRRGCGSWECGCGGQHSIPFKASGKSGSVSVTLLPAPKGVGTVGSEEAKKMLRLAGIHDVWVKTMGQTATRNNLVLAIFEALKNLNRGKGDL